MNTKVLTTLIKKELWEFSNILKWVPMVIAALVIVMPLAILCKVMKGLVNYFSY